MEEIITEFLDHTIPDMKDIEYDLTYIKFVFTDEALNEMDKYNKETVNYLRKTKNEFKNNPYNQEDIYIKVDDYNKFFYLLSELVSTYQKKENRKLLNSFNYIKSIWLRMGPSDINNVNEFLKKQLIFLHNYDLLPYYPKLYKEYNGIPVYYQNKANDDFFETDYNITFSFVREDTTDDFPIRYSYNLPSIHYALRKENDSGVCYIYGIQNIKPIKDEILKEKIQPLRKQLRNKYVSADFILALKIFIDFLKDKHISIIKVPLLQVFNYSYHEHLSKNSKIRMDSYENKEELEKRYDSGDKSPIVLAYIHDKKNYERFFDKEDSISKNKTERLVEIFMVLNEKYDDIEFLDDTFIEDENLVIRIKNVNKKTKK